MNLNESLKTLITKWQQDQKERRRERGYWKYRKTGNLRLSRIYGYHLNQQGIYEVVEAEAKVLRLVYSMLSHENPLEEIKSELDRQGARNRSKKPFSQFEIEKMVRPIFSGFIQLSNGRMVRSKYYPPIIPLPIYKKAVQALGKLKKTVSDR